MNKRLLAPMLCIAALSVATFAYSNSIKLTQSSAALEPPRREIPEHVIYRQFLHNVFVMHDEAEKAERQGRGRDATSLRSLYKRQAELSDEQSQILYEIAAQCEREVKEQDAKAKVVIDAFVARYPDGRVPSGEKLPPPSPELKGMQAERNAIILRARDRLREAFGEQEFGRLHRFIEHRVIPNIRPLSSNQK